MYTPAAGERTRHVRLFAGIFLPLFITGYGLWILATAHASVWGCDVYGSINVYGTDAVLVGITWLMSAAAMHCHLAWGRMPGTWRIAKPLAVLLYIAAVVAYLTVVLRLWMR